MRSVEIKTIYKKLVEKYVNDFPRGDPLFMLNRHIRAYAWNEWKNVKEPAILDLALREGIEIPQIRELIEKGKTRKEAILEVSKNMKFQVLEAEVETWMKRRKDEASKENKKQKLEQQIKDREKTIEKLTALLSEGEITEESYKTAIKKIEKDMKDLRSGKEISVTEEKEETIEKPKTHRRSYDYAYAYAEPTKLWYLVPLLFGIIGGLIGYVGVKDEDEDMARALLFLGFFITFVGWVMLYLYILPLLF